MTLQDLGWDAHFATAFEQEGAPGTVPARVVREDRTRFRVEGDFGSRLAALAGSLLGASERPAVGDWVAAELPAGDGPGVIRAVLPRRTAFSRKAAGTATAEQIVAANVDVVFIVAGLDGDFNVRRLERYVTQAWNSGALPILLLNKADLCADAEARRLEAEAAAPGVSVHPLSALSGDGVAALALHLTPGRTVALVGSSGVGKSTLVNRLLGEDRVATRPVRADDSRGRHTTTHRELIRLPSGALLIDTPGLRELQLWTEADALGGAFSDVEALAGRCRFSDCTHRHEPGCAVRAAVEAGRLDAAHYRSFLKLQDELAYLARRQDEAGRLEEKRRGKEGARMAREVERYHPKRRGR